MSSSMDDLLGSSVSEPLSDDGGDVEVSVVDDQPEQDREYSSGRSSDNDDEIELVGGSVQKRINKLKYEYHEERRNKESAERMREEAVTFANHVSTENRDLKELLHRGEQVLLGEIKGRASSEMEKARGEYRNAYDAGDADAILKAQESLNRSQYERETVERTAPSMPAPPSVAQQVPQTQPQDPKLQSWLQKNEWFGKDEEMTSLAYGVHEKLIKKDGVDPRTDEYYSRLDKRVRELFPGKFDDTFGAETGTEGPSARSRTNTVVASASRSSGKPRKVQLTSTQVALAKRLGITPEQYAKQLLKEYSNG
tara:strand:+ start:718 stop:1647 length:930 start_codon:yes stop_codon:yes gene_type:complete